ncbi:hypothetical protein HYX02_04640 [Candidatus Woesearchaeota archaeon]|nr:hypothetical protein [Candidatus Woesearchaeota archaeon]
MKTKAIVLLVLVLGVFLFGCTQSQSGYSTYNQPQQQGQYVGGGCGVAPSADYADTPLEALGSADSAV